MMFMMKDTKKENATYSTWEQCNAEYTQFSTTQCVWPCRSTDQPLYSCMIACPGTNSYDLPPVGNNPTLFGIYEPTQPTWTCAQIRTVPKYACWANCLDTIPPVTQTSCTIAGDTAPACDGIKLSELITLAQTWIGAGGPSSGSSFTNLMAGAQDWITHGGPA
jgi:hypothetical protein